ncbi:MAG: Ig-like domain-containing protein [bacterium]|nr:Ig-like domain-containing protein [bacterium]
MSTNNTTEATILSVHPVDGTSGVLTSTSVAVKFSRTMETMSVMSNFHLSGGTEMHEWRDSLAHSGGWGMMNMNQQNHMMNWMDSIHTAGVFHWNSNRDSCRFVPNTPLDSNTDYLCVLDGSGMRDHQGGMMGGMSQNDDGHHMFGFSTGNGPSGAPKLVSAIPSDGSTGVPPNSAIMFAFDMPMDTPTVMTNLHVIGGDDMHMWMDSLDHHLGMGGMGMMGMGEMMNWMDSIQYDGLFEWSGGMDTCIFTLDSTMMPNSDYMMFLYGDVHANNGEMMNMSQQQYDGHMIHFTTGP